MEINELWGDRVVHGSRVQCLLDVGEWQGAVAAAQEAYCEVCGQQPVTRAIADALFDLGIVHEIVNDRSQSLTFYRDALRWYKDLSLPRECGQTQEAIAAGLLNIGHLGKAVSRLNRAIAFYGEGGDAARVRRLIDAIGLADLSIDRELSVIEGGKA